MIVASTAPVGGGIGRRRWIVNAQVPAGYARSDPEAHLHEIASALGLTGLGVGMLTAADVASGVAVEDSGVSVTATVGITHPTWASSPEQAQATTPIPGTINVVAVVPATFCDAALLNLMCTATEAKSQALATARIPGTGTPTDAVAVVCPGRGLEESFGGPRSRWGAPLARAVCGSVLAGLTSPRAEP